MYGKLNKNIGFSLLPAAFIFLFEPGYTVYDILPDFIGYLIICAAIINLADINSRISDAFRLFRRAAVISILRYVAIYFLREYFVGEEQNVGILLFAFIFATAELITLLPAYKNFFDGILHLAMLHDGSAPYKCRKRGKPHATDKLYRLTIALVILRSLAMTLPELTTLKTHSLYEFVTLLRVFGVIVVLPVGIIWLICALKYCSAIRNDHAFITALSDKFTTHVTENPHFYTFRAISVGLTVASVAYVLSADIYSEHICVIPDWIFYVLLAISALILSRYSARSRYLLASGAIGVAVSVFKAVATEKFIGQYSFSAIIKDIGAYEAYYLRFFAEIAEAVVFAASLACTLLVLKDLLTSHTDLVRDGNDVFKKELKGRFLLTSILAAILGILCAAGDIYYVFSQPYYYSAWYFYYSMMISVALDIAFIFAAVALLEYIKSAVRYRYRLYI